MTLLIVLVSIAVYLMIGTLLGRADIPYYLADQRRQFPSWYASSRGDLHRDASRWWLLWITLWPAVLPITRIKRTLVGQVRLIDPETKEVENARLQQRIKELERELNLR